MYGQERARCKLLPDVALLVYDATARFSKTMPSSLIPGMSLLHNALPWADVDRYLVVQSDNFTFDFFFNQANGQRINTWIIYKSHVLLTPHSKIEKRDRGQVSTFNKFLWLLSG
jgi:hypothetical protein